MYFDEDEVFDPFRQQNEEEEEEEAARRAASAASKRKARGGSLDTRFLALLSSLKSKN